MGKNKHEQVAVVVTAEAGMAEAVAEVLQEQGTVDEATENDEAAAIMDAADDAQLNDHEGETIYEREWNACLKLAFHGQSLDVLTAWGNVPFVMAQFIANNPIAPDDAVLIQVRLTEKVVVLPNEDQRRVLLAVKLFRTYVNGVHEIDKWDSEARRVATEQEAYAARAPKKLDLTDTPYETVDGPYDATSDLARAAAARGVEA